MRHILLSLIALPALVAAETIDVNKIRLAGPYPMAKPFMTDTLDTEGKRIDLDEEFLIHNSQFIIHNLQFKEASPEGGFILSPLGETERGLLEQRILYNLTHLPNAANLQFIVKYHNIGILATR